MRLYTQKQVTAQTITTLDIVCVPFKDLYNSLKYKDILDGVDQLNRALIEKTRVQG